MAISVFFLVTLSFCAVPFGMGTKHPFPLCCYTTIDSETLKNMGTSHQQTSHSASVTPGGASNPIQFPHCALETASDPTVKAWFPTWLQLGCCFHLFLTDFPFPRKQELPTAPQGRWSLMCLSPRLYIVSKTSANLYNFRF